MQQIAINPKEITIVTVEDIKFNPDYEWRDKKTFLGITLSEEGFFEKFTWSNPKRVSEESIIDLGFLIKDHKVYRKPKVVIHTTNGQRITRVYETYGDALQDEVYNMEELRKI